MLNRNASAISEFYILEGDESIFHLNYQTGSLSLKSTLNYEAKNSFYLEVVVIDGFNNTDLANISVYVMVGFFTFVFDNPPIISMLFLFFFSIIFSINFSQVITYSISDHGQKIIKIRFIPQYCMVCCAECLCYMFLVPVPTVEPSNHIKS